MVGCGESAFRTDSFGCLLHKCDVQEAVNTLVDVKDRKTPLDMLLAFKSCIDSINDTITRNLKQHSLDLGANYWPWALLLLLRSGSN